MDQLREGLKELGVLEVITKNPTLCMPLFIYEGKVTIKEVMNVINFDSSCNAQSVQDFSRSLTAMDEDMLKTFIYFVTAARTLPRKKILVKVQDGDAIFASTCLFQLVIPKGADSYEKLSRELMYVLDTTGSSKSFTVV